MRTYYLARVDEVKINHAFRSSDHRTLCGRLYDKINKPIGDVLSCVACQTKVTGYSYSLEIKVKPKVYLRFHNDTQMWYIYRYRISDRQLRNFADMCWYHPVVKYDNDDRLYIVIHPSRQELVLECAMDFAKYFDLELEIN